MCSLWYVQPPLRAAAHTRLHSAARRLETQYSPLYASCKPTTRPVRALSQLNEHLAFAKQGTIELKRQLLCKVMELLVRRLHGGVHGVVVLLWLARLAWWCSPSLRGVLCTVADPVRDRHHREPAEPVDRRARDTDHRLPMRRA